MSCKKKIDEEREELRRLQDMVQKAFDHLYLYYYKKIRDGDETFDITQSLSCAEKYLLTIEAESSLIQVLLVLRSLFDKNKNSLSLISFCKNITSYNGCNCDKKNCDCIIVNIIGDDRVCLFKKIKEIVNKRIAHYDNGVSVLDLVSYNDLEELLGVVEKVLYRDLPLLIYQESGYLSHNKDTIKAYCKKIFCTHNP